MDKFVDIVLANLPLPVVIGIALIVICAWIIKQAKGYEKNSQIFKDKIFYIIITLIIASIAGYYYVIMNFPKAENFDVSFTPQEIGIYICPFQNDQSAKIVNAMHTILKATFNSLEMPEIRVEKSALPHPPNEKELLSIGTVRNASLVISGTVIQDQQYMAMLTNVSVKKSEWIDPSVPPINISDTTRLTEAIMEELQPIIQQKKGAFPKCANM